MQITERAVGKICIWVILAKLNGPYEIHFPNIKSCFFLHKFELGFHKVGPDFSKKKDKHSQETLSQPSIQDFVTLAMLFLSIGT